MTSSSSGPILLIDDEPMLCRVLSLALRSLGRQVLTFTDPLLAVQHLALGEPPSVVICDYCMPKLTGLDVLQSLPDAVPFVLISGDLAAADLAATRPGITAFLRKPVRPEDLLAAVSPLVAPAL